MINGTVKGSNNGIYVITYGKVQGFNSGININATVGDLNNNTKYGIYVNGDVIGTDSGIYLNATVGDTIDTKYGIY